MNDVMTMLPIYAFMLIPVWIPMIAMALGGLSDMLRASRDTARSAARSAAQQSAKVSAGRQVPAAGSAH